MQPLAGDLHIESDAPQNAANSIFTIPDRDYTPQTRTISEPVASTYQSEYNDAVDLDEHARASAVEIVMESSGHVEDDHRQTSNS